MQISTPAIVAGLLLATSTQAQISGENATRRAAETESRMTDEERFSLLHGIMPAQFPGLPPVDIPEGVKPSAGYVQGVPRLGIPALRETDASLGVANIPALRPGDVATALPAGLALAAGFDPEMMQRTGAMIASEAKAKGFNVLLAGGINLTRDPRGGRNFEYLGEDPLLAGVLGAAAIRGIQSQGVLSTIKHLVLNDQETQRDTLNARIDAVALRESDLLAFEIGIERGAPGAVMCAYNRVNGPYACGSDWLLNSVLKQDWGYRGWVMSDWQAVHSVEDFRAGLDQESGAQLDEKIWFGTPLQDAVKAGRISRTRVSDAVRRILWSIYKVGVREGGHDAAIDYAAHGGLAREAATQGMVLLKNGGALPIAASARRILVVGGHADRGVLSGSGSSQVWPVGAPGLILPAFSEPVAIDQIYVPSPPFKALRAALPDATITFDSGYEPETAAAAARRADLVILFATRWQTESADAGSMTLPEGQDALIEAVARANPNSVVVLETGNPVAMPWLDQVNAVAEAWYPGQEGGAAIADILTGKANPSGHLPMTFPVALEDSPRGKLAGLDLPPKSAVEVVYAEGAKVGYRDLEGKRPLFPFGFGLSYTRFEQRLNRVRAAGGALVADVEVRNVGDRAGATVAQLYLTTLNGKPVKRLAAFGRATVKPGGTETLSLVIEPRILSRWNGRCWVIDPGLYAFAEGLSAEDLGTAKVIGLRRPRFTGC